MAERTVTASARTGVLHVHSDYSHDGRYSLEAVRDFALERGIAFVALSDHAEDFTELLFAEFVSRCDALSDDAVTLIPGLEFRFAGHAGLHLLALGLTRWLSPTRPEAFIEQARAAGARLTIAAHPVLFDYLLPPAVRLGIDAIEVWNAAYNTRYLPDARAIRLFASVRQERSDIVATVGLDQHDASNDREVRVMVPASAGDPLTAIRAGRFRNVGRTMSFDPALSWGPIRLRTLATARWAFDRVERLHERIARSRAR